MPLAIAEAFLLLLATDASARAAAPTTPAVRTAELSACARARAAGADCCFHLPRQESPEPLRAPARPTPTFPDHHKPIQGR